MSTFIYGTQLSFELESMILNADRFLWFISPYIKLHDRIKQEMKRKLEEDHLEIVIVFGKNENDVSKSISLEDIEFLKQFPNIKICYEKTLHAKFYASEDACLITSMNLHQFSQNTNIEAGVVLYTRSHLKKLAGLVTDTVDPGEDAIGYFRDVIKQSEIIFEKVPKYSEGFFSSKYLNSEIATDKIESFFATAKSDYKTTRPNSFSEASVLAGSGDKKTLIPRQSEALATFKPGFCIRTGVAIAFNPEKPLCFEAFKSWNQNKNANYPEKYCHFSGEASNGETCVSRPILRKNWSKAKSFIS